MAKLSIEIDRDTIKEIESCYGKANQKTVRNTVEDILDRYLHPEYFNSEIVIDDKN